MYSIEQLMKVQGVVFTMLQKACANLATENSEYFFDQLAAIESQMNIAQIEETSFASDLYKILTEGIYGEHYKMTDYDADGAVFEIKSYDEPFIFTIPLNQRFQTASLREFEEQIGYLMEIGLCGLIDEMSGAYV